MNLKFFQTTLLLSATAFLVSASPNAAIMRRQSNSTINPSLVEPFGIIRGQNPQNGMCSGVEDDHGVPSLIRCHCPPDRDIFLRTLESTLKNMSIPEFPPGNDTLSHLARLGIMLMAIPATPVNGREPCNANSTRWVRQIKESIPSNTTSSSLMPSSTSFESPSMTFSSPSPMPSSMSFEPPSMTFSLPSSMPSSIPSEPPSMTFSSSSSGPFEPPSMTYSSSSSLDDPFSTSVPSYTPQK